MSSAPWLGRQRWAGEASGHGSGSSRVLQSCWVLPSLTGGRPWGGWEMVLVLTPFPRAPPTGVKCCWQHRWVNCLETGVKTFYKYGRGRRDFPELPQWGGHRVCPGSPSSAARAALQLCKGTPRGLPGALWVSPAGPEHPPALPWLWVLPRRHLTSWAPATGRQHLPTLPLCSPCWRGIYPGRERDPASSESCPACQHQPSLCPWAEPELNISNLKLSENSP